MRLWLITQLWKINYIRRRWCWGSAACWAMGLCGLPERVDPACDYCGNCKDAKKENGS